MIHQTYGLLTKNILILYVHIWIHIYSNIYIYKLIIIYSFLYKYICIHRIWAIVRMHLLFNPDSLNIHIGTVIIFNIILS